MLTIRLQRVGKKKFPVYRLVVSEKARDPQARHLEIVGTYNPHDKENGLVLKEDRIKHWIASGAQMSNTVNNLLLKNSVITGDKKKSVTISKKRTGKLASSAEASAAAKVKADEEKATEAVPAVEPEPVVEEK